MGTILKEMQEEHAAMKAEIDLLRGKMQAKSKILMTKSFEEFFNVYGDLVDSVFWTQYSPHFNDGEACEFSVHEVFILMKDDDDADYYEGSEIYTESDIQDFKKYIASWEAFELDPIKEALSYQSDRIKRYSRDPFAAEPFRYGREKTSEQKIAEWRPHYKDKDDVIADLKSAENQIANYPDLERDVQVLKNMVSSFDEDLMEAMFGNGVKVIVTKTAIEVEDYDHD